jgi:hypothetical protein
LKKSDFELAGWVTFVIGMLCVLGAFVADSYEQDVQVLGLTVARTYPYADYELPLMFIGAAFLAIGAGFLWRSKQEEGQTMRTPQTLYSPPSPQTQPAPRRCPNCGTELQSDDRYCRKCGTVLPA